MVRRLATKGRIAWVTTSPADVVADLDAQLELDVEPLRVTVEMQDSDVDEPTPKLSSVARWLDKMKTAGEADWDSVVWIDDVLGPDVHDWAYHLNQPVLLEKPVPEEGLTEAHVVAVQVFIDGGKRGGRPTRFDQGLRSELAGRVRCELGPCAKGRASQHLAANFNFWQHFSPYAVKCRLGL